MANTKRVNKEDVQIEIGKEESNVEIDPRDELIAQLQKQMLEMQKAFIAIQGSKVNDNGVTENDERFEVGTRLVNGVTIYSPRREVEKELPFNKDIEIDKYELDMLLKSNFVREWFEKDILFFIDESVYTKKKIKREFDLSDESLIELILNKPVGKVMERISEFTRKYKDDPMIHCIFYRIVELCSNGKLSTMPYETRKEIEKAFNFKIDDAQMLFRGFRDVK